jgi:hypothetical protein
MMIYIALYELFKPRERFVNRLREIYARTLRDLPFIQLVIRLRLICDSMPDGAQQRADSIMLAHSPRCFERFRKLSLPPPWVILFTRACQTINSRTRRPTLAFSQRERHERVTFRQLKMGA